MGSLKRASRGTTIHGACLNGERNHGFNEPDSVGVATEDEVGEGTVEGQTMLVQTGALLAAIGVVLLEVTCDVTTEADAASTMRRLSS